MAPASNAPSPLVRFAAWLPAALLVAAVAVVYANSLDAPFLFDDAGAVVENPTIRRFASTAVFFPPADGSTTTGRPLVNLSFALDHALHGLSPRGFRLTNLALHAASACLLFAVLRRTLAAAPGVLPGGAGTPSRPGFTEQRHTALVAFAAAALWALHPLQTESVVCIAQRTELLCGFLYLAMLWAFARAVEPPAASAPASRRWLAVSGAACLAGMAAKEVMVTAPLLVLLYDRTFVAGTFAAAWRARRAYYLALASTWLVLAALVASGGGARGVAAGLGLGVSSWSYLLTQCEALVLYLRLAVWPHPLVLDYGTGVVTSAAAVWWQGPVVLALLAATVWALVRRPRWGFAGAWWFLILAPSSSFVPLVTQTIAEHRLYLPLAAVVVPAVVAVARLRPPFALVGVAAIALVFAALTHRRNCDYRDPIAIWSANIAAHPQGARAHHNLALVLAERGRSAEAHAAFARAVALDPGYVAAHASWAVALLAERRFDEAIARFQHALTLAPREGATAAKLRPALAETYVELGRLAERERGGATAETHYRAALALLPTCAPAHARLGLLCAKTDRLADAARHLAEAVRLAPDDVESRVNLGNVLLLQDRPREALAQYESALRARPDDPRLRENIRLARDALR